MRKIAPAFLVAVIVLAAVPLAAAQQTVSSNDLPIVVWQPPASYSLASPGGLTRFAQIGPGPAPFYPITPCRQYDSRSASPLLQNTPRIVTLTGAPCGVPGNTYALAVNITIFDITGAGSNGVFKVGTASPPTTAWINYPPTETQRGNAGVVATDGSSIWVQINQGAGSVNFTVDVYGYYYNGVNGLPTTMPAGDWIGIVGSKPGYPGVLAAYNIETSGTNSSGVFGGSSSTGTGSAGVWGQTSVGSGQVYGVKGTSASGDTNSAGVFGSAAAGAGVSGLSTSGIGIKGHSVSGGDGVYGMSDDASGSGVHGVLTPDVYAVPAVSGEHKNTLGGGIGVRGSHAGTGVGVYGVSYGATGINARGVIGQANSTTDGTAGVEGDAYGATGRTYGVLGVSLSTSDQAYGVVGNVGGATWNPLNSYQAGGRFVGGQSSSHGVVAEGRTTAVIGYRVDGTGSPQNYGSVGYLGTDGLYTPNHLTAVGGKSFAEPLPTDPSRVIKYVCPEGPESGTYFRGRGRFANHTAVIEVPEHFRIVTEEEGLTVQITPIGRATAVGVLRIGLDQIEVEATRDVEFSYLVQGVRKAYKDWQPVQNATPSENPYFIPQSASHKLESFWPEEIKRRLVQNGTYYADGTVNMSTAEREGWAQVWRQREEQAKAAPAPKVSNTQNNK